MTMAKLRIFVVDDDEDVADGLADVLEDAGHAVVVAYNGEDAVRIFGEQDFDIAFMDVMMPGKNGVESFLEIRHMKPDANVVMMTGYSVEQLLQQAVDNGAIGVLYKPLHVSKILQILEDVYRQKGIVLVADDDPAFCESIKLILEEHDYRIRVANTGQEALEHIDRSDVDILVLDLRLPIISGLEIHAELKSRGCRIPTIITTGNIGADRKTIDALRDPSVTGILVKPFDPERLVQSLNDILVRAA